MAPSCLPPLLPLLLLLLLSTPLIALSYAEPEQDKAILLNFLFSLPHSHYINWSPATPVCSSWTGVTCSADSTRVVALRLPGLGFFGQIPPNTLGGLSALQVLSLRSNSLFGPFPEQLLNLGNLTSLHLQFNSFSGPLPKNISVLKNLTVLDLSFNEFNGSIPESVNELTNLAALNLSNNSLSGEISVIELPGLQFLNLSNNVLTGDVPRSLQRFPESAFAGNNLTRVVPLAPALAPSLSLSPTRYPTENERNKSSKLGQSAILAILVGCCAAIFAIMGILMLFCCSRKGNENADVVKKDGLKERGSPEKAVSGKAGESNRLVFFEGPALAFDLEDLLHASAEVLGKGAFGTAYRAVLEDATTVVVKRLREVGAGRREFEQQMEVLGRIRHENVVELRAYYYSKDEKLLVYDFYTRGSVSNLLHGQRGEDRVPLDWETRLKIALGAAIGISRIHTENNGKFVHGNVKASNVFLNTQQYGCVSDIGLAALMNPIIAPVSRSTGYRAPELVDRRKATQASDVYSFGVLLLELLTGKSPIQLTGGREEVVHLVRWVHSVVREEWTAEVFDIELMRYPNIEEEMVEMLQIAMTCVLRVPEQRPKMSEVVRMIEDVRRFDTGTRPSTEGSTPAAVQHRAESSSTAY